MATNVTQKRTVSEADLPLPPLKEQKSDSLDQLIRVADTVGRERVPQVSREENLTRIKGLMDRVGYVQVLSTFLSILRAHIFSEDDRFSSPLLLKWSKEEHLPDLIKWINCEGYKRILGCLLFELDRRYTPQIRAEAVSILGNVYSSIETPAAISSSPPLTKEHLPSLITHYVEKDQLVLSEQEAEMDIKKMNSFLARQYDEIPLKNLQRVIKLTILMQRLGYIQVPSTAKAEVGDLEIKSDFDLDFRSVEISQCSKPWIPESAAGYLNLRNVFIFRANPQNGNRLVPIQNP